MVSQQVNKPILIRAGIARSSNEQGYAGYAHLEGKSLTALAAPTKAGAVTNLAGALFPAWGAGPGYDVEYGDDAQTIIGPVSTDIVPPLPWSEHVELAWCIISRQLLWNNPEVLARELRGDAAIWGASSRSDREQLVGAAFTRLGERLAVHREELLNYQKLRRDPLASSLRRTSVWTWVLTTLQTSILLSTARAIALHAPTTVTITIMPGDVTVDIVGGPQCFDDVEAWAADCASAWCDDPENVEWLRSIRRCDSPLVIELLRRVRGQ